MVLRQLHRAGEKTFVDFCDGIPLIDIETGELIPTQLFVGALGGSPYTLRERHALAGAAGVARLPCADVRVHFAAPAL